MFGQIGREGFQRNSAMSGSHVPVGADPKIKEIITSLDDDKIGEGMLNSCLMIGGRVPDVRLACVF